MRRIAIAAFLTICCSAAAIPSWAKTASATFTENAQIISGNSVSAYLAGNEIVTQIGDEPAGVVTLQGIPIVRIGFEMQPSWHLVKRVTWDKRRHQLTIDF